MDSIEPDDWIFESHCDYVSADILAKSGNPYVISRVCFGCQQAAEKMFKAYLLAKGDNPPKNHDVEKLLVRCSHYFSGFNRFSAACSVLNTYESTTRYPAGKRYSGADMEQALKDTSQILEFTKSKLKDLGYELPPDTPTPISPDKPDNNFK